MSFSYFLSQFYNNLAGILEEKKLLESLKSENFDVGICELFDFTGIPVFEAIGLKNIVGAHTTSCLMEGTAYAIGAPVIPSYMPASQGVTDDSPSLVNRFINILFTFTSWYFQTSIARAAEIAMVEKLGDSATPIWDTVSNMSWILTNTEPLLEFAKPTLHKVIDIGGIGVAKPKPLDEKWHKILSLREHTILISFGSVAASIYMPYEMKVAIVDVVKSYPDVTFIWKYEEPGDSFAAGVENLFLSKWTPQVDLLADDRLTLFITHGGAGSMMESATGGKPLIVVPLFGDQTRNAKLIAKFGFGIMLHKSSLLDRSALRDAIGRALKDERYRKAAHRIRDLLARRPFTPEQKLVKTIEMAAEFGEIEELRVAGRKLGFIVYYNIDLILTFFIFVVLLVWIVLYNVKRICILRSLKPKVKEQ
ncbi:hypothetical protein Y032_0123g1154 [Ancylostoma ceylanicum]|uniref:UDP-glucuronosyltransferase n=1 Tax=Ancylostoma ceylanicum TaxID=53326 RepID=A0A016T9I7_9BILA|nr:hypothetical protein Y032_0123g1154 [Ancylostoma ceylanicum]